MGRLAERVLSRRQVEGLIAAGRTIIILDKNVLQVDAWLKFHPGGDKAILHMVGRDATDEINAYVLWNYLLANSYEVNRSGIVYTPPGPGIG